MGRSVTLKDLAEQLGERGVRTERELALEALRERLKLFDDSRVAMEKQAREDHYVPPGHGLVVDWVKLPATLLQAQDAVLRSWEEGDRVGTARALCSQAAVCVIALEAVDRWEIPGEDTGRLAAHVCQALLLQNAAKRAEEG